MFQIWDLPIILRSSADLQAPKNQVFEKLSQTPVIIETHQSLFSFNILKWMQGNSFLGLYTTWYSTPVLFKVWFQGFPNNFKKKLVVRCLCLTTGVSHCTNLPIVDCFRLTKSCPSPAITAALWDVDPLLRGLFPVVLVQWCTIWCVGALAGVWRLLCFACTRSVASVPPLLQLR